MLAGEWKPDRTAMVLNESHTGCGLAFSGDLDLAVGDGVRFRVGKLGPLPATVVWRTLVFGQLLRIGVKYDL